MVFMLGSSLSRLKPPLKTSRFCLEPLDSLSFLLDPSWDFVSCKKNYFLAKKVIFHLHTKLSLSPRILPKLGNFDPTKRLYKERQFNLFVTFTQQVWSSIKRGRKRVWSIWKMKVGKTKSRFWAVVGAENMCLL